MRRHFFGACTIGLGAWEALAFAGRGPTITSVCRARRRLRIFWICWLLAVGRHLWSGK